MIIIIYKFILKARTPVSFLYSYLILGAVFEDDDVSQVDFNKQDLDLEFEKKMVNLATKCILNSKFKSLHASSIACAIVFEVRRDLNILPHWRSELSALTSHDPNTNKSVLSALELIKEMKSDNKFEVQADNNEPECSVELNNLSINQDEKPKDIVDMKTPDNNNKENKGIKESELSPVSIANLNVM